MSNPLNKATPKRKGPPKGSINAAKNGTRLARLTLGELPRTMRRQTAAARAYRRDLEQAVLDAKGEVNATDAHLIDEASSAEVHASVCRWLLRTRLDKMTVGDVARCSEQIVKAKASRNRAVERLGLDRDHREDMLTALYGPTPAQLPAPEPTTDGDTTDESE